MADGWLTWAGGKRKGGLAGSIYPRVNTPWKSNSVGSKRSSRKILLKHGEVSANVSWAGLKALSQGSRERPNLSGPSDCPGAVLRAGPGPWRLLHCTKCGQGRATARRF